MQTNKGQSSVDEFEKTRSKTLARPQERVQGHNGRNRGFRGTEKTAWKKKTRESLAFSKRGGEKRRQGLIVRGQRKIYRKQGGGIWGKRGKRGGWGERGKRGLLWSSHLRKK